MFVLFFVCSLQIFVVLTPVNEYNIVEKIQSANNQLFASINNDMNGLKQTQENTDNKSNRIMLQPKHRVTFSSDIEEYEDEISDGEIIENQYKDDDDIDKEVAEIIERDENLMMEFNKIDGLMERMTIEEAYLKDDNDDNESISEDNDFTTDVEVPEEMKNVEETANDCQSTETITNLIVPQNAKEKEKNMLSLNQSAIQSNEHETPCRKCNKSYNTVSSKQYIKRPTTSHISTEFKRSPQSNRSASANTHRNLRSKCTTNQNELLKIHLNVRACCENKYLDNNRLPRYNGYISQYGLSKDQLELRELNRQKYMEKRARREREIIKAKQEIADLNEQAFRAWLIRKNHVARPKYKNFYDEPVQKPRIKYHSSKKFQKSNEYQT